MSGGKFLLSREIFDHPIVGIRHPQRFAAWCWLISEARWKPGVVEVNGRLVTLQRGELCHTVRFMADAVGMSRSTFERFLTRLKTGTENGTESGTLIGTRNEVGVLIISIRNYDRFQATPSKTGTGSGTGSGTESGTGNGTRMGQRKEGSYLSLREVYSNTHARAREDEFTPDQPEGEWPKPGLMPGNFQLPPDGAKFAAQSGLSAERTRIEAIKFAAHYRSTTGNARSRGWRDTWIKWVCGVAADLATRPGQSSGEMLPGLEDRTRRRLAAKGEG